MMRGDERCWKLFYKKPSHTLWTRYKQVNNVSLGKLKVCHCGLFKTKSKSLIIMTWYDVHRKHLFISYAPYMYVIPVNFYEPVDN